MMRSFLFVPGKGPVRAGTQGKFRQSTQPLNSDNRADMVTSDRKMGWNCDIDREKRKDNSNIPTAKWIPPQYAKQEVLTFRLETYVTLLKP